MTDFDLSQLHLYEKWGPMGTKKGTTTSIVASPDTTFTELGETQQITVVNQAGTTLTDYLTFSSNNAKTTVSATGLITAVASGTSTITVTYSEPDDTPLTDTITVSTTNTQSITITGAAAYSLYEMKNYSLYVENQAGTEVTYDCTYTSSNTGVCTVLVDNGTFTFGATSGTSIISVVHTATGVSGTTTVDTTGVSISVLTVSPTGGTHVTGTTFVITFTDQLGNDVTQYVDKPAGQEVYVTDWDETTGTVTLGVVTGSPSLSFSHLLWNKSTNYEAEII